MPEPWDPPAFRSEAEEEESAKKAKQSSFKKKKQKNSKTRGFWGPRNQVKRISEEGKRSTVSNTSGKSDEMRAKK